MADDRKSSNGAPAGMAGADAATGDSSEMRSEGGGPAAGSTGGDAGSPGGMGGVRASGGTGTDRPSGGLSPMTYDRSRQENEEEPGDGKG